MIRAIAVLALVGLPAPVFAQYGGPAILARGQAPGPMAMTQIDFRPFVTVGGSYDTGLNGVGVDVNGRPVNDSSYGIDISGGISGTHSWKHTSLGLDYAASFRHNPGHSFYDGTNQSLLLAVTHQLSRHMTISWHNDAGISSSNYYALNLPSTIPFDPSTTYVPTTDFFDNRTIYLSSQARLTVRKSARLSYSVGASGFLTRRRSTALFGVSGVGANGDIQYRVSRRSTIGGGYAYTKYTYHGVFSGTDLHAFTGSYSIAISRALEFSAYAGVMRYEIKFIEIVAIDPAIAALVGISSARQVAYHINSTPTFGARLSYTLRRGVLYANGGHSITPGNGLFLTSTSTNAGVGYTYTARRNWTIGATAIYTYSDSLGNFVGAYGSYSSNLTIGRQVAPYTHGLLTFSARRYNSGDFRNYNKWAYGIRLGLGFAPGDVPIRLW